MIFTSPIAIMEDVKLQMNAFKRRWAMEYHHVSKLSDASQLLRKRDSKTKVVVFMNNELISIPESTLDIIHQTPFSSDKEGNVMAGELGVIKPMLAGHNTMKGQYRKWLPSFKKTLPPPVPLDKPQFSTTTTMASGMRVFEFDVEDSESEEEEVVEILHNSPQSEEEDEDDGPADENCPEPLGDEIEDSSEDLVV